MNVNATIFFEPNLTVLKIEGSPSAPALSIAAISPSASGATGCRQFLFRE
jgi:hypothetical protein